MHSRYSTGLWSSGALPNVQQYCAYQAQDWSNLVRLSVHVKYCTSIIIQKSNYDFK